MILRLHAEAGCVREARHWIAQGARDHGAEPGVVGTLALVISELVTNAAKYGPPGGAIMLEADRVGTGFEIRISDESDEAPVLLPSEPDQIGGHGVRIVQHLTAGWDVQMHVGGGKSISFRVPF